MKREVYRLYVSVELIEFDGDDVTFSSGCMDMPRALVLQSEVKLDIAQARQQIVSSYVKCKAKGAGQ